MTATAASLERSLQSTCQGLATFLRSLEQAGLKDALRPYQQMQLTLLQQRAWAGRHGRAELSPLWRRLAETAGAIQAIMAGFATVMESLKDIDRVEAIDAPAVANKASADVAEAQALAGVLREFSLSLARVAKLGAVAGGAPLVDRLLAAGVLDVRGRGGGRSFCLSQTVRRDLATCLARRLNGSGRAGQAGTTET